MITTEAQLNNLLPHIESVDRVAIDTEADSLHCYREKLCLLQVSVPDADFVVDPLADVDLAPLRDALVKREIILHGSDYDLRLLRRSLNFNAKKIFDTVIAARLLGIREFSLAALVKKYFGIELVKGSQKADWGQRPLPERMLQYAINDTHYLLPLAAQLETQLQEAKRLDWFRESCQRAIEQAATDRTRDVDEAWRIAGSGALPPRTAAVIRELWRWRESEAEAADRPTFHILQNRELIRAAEKFAAGGVPDFKYFSPRRRASFRAAAERALQLSEDQLPQKPRRAGKRPTAEMVRRTEELKKRRDRVAENLKLEGNLIAPRAALEAIASEETSAKMLLTSWQRQILGLEA